MAAKGREVWHAKRGDAPVPSVQFTINQDEAQKYREQGSIVFSPSVVSSAPTTKGGSSANALAEALITVLTAYGVFEDRTYEEQQALVEAILSVFAAESL